jgi:hypothetical protein
MKRRLQVLALCATALLAVHMMGQDNAGGGGGGGGGATGGDATSQPGDATGAPPVSQGGETVTPLTPSPSASGGTPAEQPLPGATPTDQNGTMITPDANSLFESGTGSPSTITPGQGAPAATPIPAPTPAATASPTPTTFGAPNAGTIGASQNAPVTFNLPGAYGGGVPQSFTLGEGRLAKPPITFTLSVSQGYDNNLFSATAHPVYATPIPTPTPPLEARIVGYVFRPPSGPPRPLYQYFRAQGLPTPTPAATPLGIIGSPVSTASVGMQIQKGTTRTVLTMDANVGIQDYWDQPGGKIDDTANFDMSLYHRLSPRAAVAITANAVYQKSPNFSLVNAPTNNGNGGNYLNGSMKIDLNYAWTRQVSTVSSYSLGFNILQNTAAQNLYSNTFGTQFRYTVSARNTLTSELRENYTVYPSDASLNNSGTFYLLGLDTFLSARLRNTISGGLESYTLVNSQSKWLPYVESATSYALPRGASVYWSNSYGAEPSQSVGQTTISYRTSVGYNQPLSTKLQASVSMAYNYVESTDSTPGYSYNQEQLQISLSLAYDITPRFGLSLSYNYFDLLTTQINSAYQRQQVYFGGNYTFR